MIAVNGLNGVGVYVTSKRHERPSSRAGSLPPAFSGASLLSFALRVKPQEEKGTSYQGARGFLFNPTMGERQILGY